MLGLSYLKESSKTEESVKCALIYGIISLGSFDKSILKGNIFLKFIYNIV